MAWNPSPKVAAARNYGRKFGQEVVIIIGLNADFTQYEIISYGKDKKLCADAENIAAELEKAIKELEL